MKRILLAFLAGVLLASCGRAIPVQPIDVAWCVKHATRVDTVWAADSTIAAIYYAC